MLAKLLNWLVRNAPRIKSVAKTLVMAMDLLVAIVSMPSARRTAAAA